MIGGILAIVILLAAALLHFYWAAGGRWGHGAAVPEHQGKPMFVPGKLATVAVAAALIVAAILLAMRIGLLLSPLPHWLLSVVLWAMVVVFAARAMGDFRAIGFSKRIADTRFARLDTLFYSPLCLILAVAVADAAIEGPG